MHAIRVGGEEAEFLEIAALSRSHPDCTDYWDGNWLRARVEVAGGGFRGAATADLRAEELADFHTQLRRVAERLTGRLSFARWKDGCRSTLPATALVT